MNYYKATIQYDGTNYFGFQWQKDIPTIQNDFTQTLIRLIGGKITTMGASRTDTGVHAIEQIVKITSENEINCASIFMELNKELPTQIKCLRIASCEGSYKPVTDSLFKEYRYFFTNSIQTSGTDQIFVANNPYPLDINLMKKCIDEIVGEHDFHNFCSTGSNVKSTVRKILSCELSEVNPHNEISPNNLFKIPYSLTSCYQFKIEGNGFLKQMVRHLVSALWMVGGGKMTPEEFSLLLNGPKKSKRLWKAADSRGLFLYRIAPRSSGR